MCWQIMQLVQDALNGVRTGVYWTSAISVSGGGFVLKLVEASC